MAQRVKFDEPGSSTEDVQLKFDNPTLLYVIAGYDVLSLLLQLVFLTDADESFTRHNSPKKLIIKDEKNSASIISATIGIVLLLLVLHFAMTIAMFCALSHEKVTSRRTCLRWWMCGLFARVLLNGCGILAFWNVIKDKEKLELMGSKHKTALYIQVGLEAVDLLACIFAGKSAMTFMSKLDKIIKDNTPRSTILE